ncbi:MAG: hypothetical protein LH610_11930 [Sphingomonas bacterium]|nr:hypothetical protein [Sphingomonas bacterium]
MIRCPATALLASAAFVASAAGPAKEPAITSAYTNLDLDRCKQLEHSDEGEWSVWRCPGYAGVPLFVESGDGRFDVDAGTLDKDEHWSAPFYDIPARVEWRVKAGKPFALIYRLTIATPEVPRTSRLLVETIGRGSKPGCRVADIPGATPAANTAARRAADQVAQGTARCLKR